MQFPFIALIAALSLLAGESQCAEGSAEILSVQQGAGEELSEPDWTEIEPMEVATNALPLVQITSAGDGSGRMFVVEAGGRVLILKEGRLLEVPFLDLTERILEEAGERSLSIVFPKDFGTTGEFYVNYVRSTDGSTVLARYRVSGNPDIADFESGQELLVVPPAGADKTANRMAFGPDGFLYIGTRDWKGYPPYQGQGQYAGSLLGKILRIDVSGSGSTYSIPESNPRGMWANSRREIWALGLFDPHPSFDAVTGDLYIQDGHEAHFSEINFEAGGSTGARNYGWPAMSGPYGSPPAPPYENPVMGIPLYGPLSYSDPFVGGLACRGGLVESLEGTYLFVRPASGRLAGLKPMGGEWRTNTLGFVFPGITSLAEGEEIYGTQNFRGTNRIVRLVDSRRVLPPEMNPSFGTFYAEQWVKLVSATPGAMIHYRRDGLEPSEEDPFVQSGESILVNETQRISARAYRSDLLPSRWSSLPYTLKLHVQFDPPPGWGSVTNGTPLTLSTTELGVIIRYTLDGSPVTSESPVYQGPILLEGNQQVTVNATKPGWTPHLGYPLFYGLLQPERVAVRLFAGTGRAGKEDGPFSSATFNGPEGLTMDAEGSLYVADYWNSVIRKVSPMGDVTTVNTTERLYWPFGVTVDSNNKLFVTDRFAYKVFEISPDGTLRTVAGGGKGGYQDGTRESALFSIPGHIEAHADGVLYVTDHKGVRRVTRDGRVSSIQFGKWRGVGIGIDGSGKIFVAMDTGTIYEVGDGVGELFSGTEFYQNHSDGHHLGALFSTADSKDIAADRDGNFYVTDGKLIRKIEPSGQVKTLLLTSGGTVGKWPIQTASGIVADNLGNLYVADTDANRIMKIGPDTDSDGILDTEEGEETAYTLGISDWLVDSDGDGQSNAQEYVFGTDPKQAESSFSMEFSRVNRQLEVSWSTVAGHYSNLESSDDLVTWWRVYPSAVEVVDDRSMQSSRSLMDGTKFYRVRVSRY